MNKLGLTLLCAACFSLFSCDKELQVTSKLNSDRSLDRTVAIADKDSSAYDHNIFGIQAKNGWQVESSALNDTSDQVFSVLTKHFPSIEAANKEMNVANDTLLQIDSKLESRFRWFYTYHRYTDTYPALNRFRHKNIRNYFTQEDLAFIDRVSDGELGQADSLFLEYIGDKIFEGFATYAWIGEIEQTIYSVLDEVGLSTIKSTINVSRLLDEDESLFDDDLDDIVPLSKKLGVPVDTLGIANLLSARYLEVEQRINFMGNATSLELVHMIEVPGAIIETNALQVYANKATWSPRIIKLCLQPYTMYAEYRTLNWWAIIISAIAVLSGFVFVLRPRQRPSGN